MQYAIVIEQTDTNYSAYVPDLPVSVATGSNLEDIETHIRRRKGQALYLTSYKSPPKLLNIE